MTRGSGKNSELNALVETMSNEAGWSTGHWSLWGIAAEGGFRAGIGLLLEQGYTEQDVVGMLMAVRDKTMQELTEDGIDIAVL